MEVHLSSNLAQRMIASLRAPAYGERLGERAVDWGNDTDDEAAELMRG
jgi:hypothetical protein